MNIKALQLASRFSLAPNSLGYCGRDSATERFVSCIQKGNCEFVEEELRKFIVLHPYYKTLANITKLPIISYELIEAYWIGNTLLDQASLEHYGWLLKAFKEQGVPDSHIAELKKNPPPVFIPNHLFQVLYIGVGRASGAVPFNIESINNCMIRWGTVEKIESTTITAKLHSLKKYKSTYRVIRKKESLSVNTAILPDLKAGDSIGVHWHMPVKKLTPQEVINLEYWTKKTIQSLAL